jgi:hypothetical protein
MTHLSPEANNTLYANPAGESLAEQLQSAYARNVNEGRVVASDSLASVAGAAVAAAEADTEVAFNLEQLTERQREIAEGILGQVESSWHGMEATAAALNMTALAFRDRMNILSEAELEEQVESTLLDWANRGVLDYLADKLEADPDMEFTLVATPIPTADQWPDNKPEAAIQAGFKEFAAGQPNATTDYIYDSYCQGYTREDICGQLQTDGNTGPTVDLSLVPTKFSSDEVLSGAVADQQEALLNLQTTSPDLGYHVSSPLTQLTRLYTLRAQQPDGEPLQGFDLTFIRNFDLPLVDGCVPFSCVYGGGYVNARGGGAGFDGGARVAVG